MSKKYIGYFICPVCNTENTIPNWRTVEGEPLKIILTTWKYSLSCNRIRFKCKCGTKLEFGLKEIE